MLFVINNVMFCNSYIIILICPTFVAASCLLSSDKSDETIPGVTLPQMVITDLTDLKHRNDLIKFLICCCFIGKWDNVPVVEGA